MIRLLPIALTVLILHWIFDVLVLLDIEGKFTLPRVSSELVPFVSPLAMACFEGCSTPFLAGMMFLSGIIWSGLAFIVAFALTNDRKGR